MKLEEARKLAMLGPLGNPLYAATLKEANDVDLALERHYRNHFDEVVKALEHLIEHDDTEHNGCDRDPCDYCYARQVLAKTKEVKI